jgi:hypothetical protein
MTVIFNCYICIVLRSRPFKFLGFARIFVHTKQMSDYLLFCISRVIFSRNFGDKIYLFRKKHNPAYKSYRLVSCIIENIKCPFFFFFLFFFFCKNDFLLPLWNDDLTCRRDYAFFWTNIFCRQNFLKKLHERCKIINNLLDIFNNARYQHLWLI